MSLGMVFVENELEIALFVEGQGSDPSGGTDRYVSVEMPSGKVKDLVATSYVIDRGRKPIFQESLRVISEG